MTAILKLLGAVVLAGALPGCGDSDSSDDEGPLEAIFWWLNLLGGTARSVADGPALVEVGGSVPAGGAVTQVRWFNETTGEQGLAEGTSTWTARVPVIPGVNAVTVTAYDAEGRFSSSSRRVIYEDSTVRFAEPD